MGWSIPTTVLTAVAVVLAAILLAFAVATAKATTSRRPDAGVRSHRWPWWSTELIGSVILLVAIALAVVFLGKRLLRSAAGSAASMSSPALQAGGGEGAGGQCAAEAAHTCGAEDPVSDPDYNMREIAKQSILLEEHLIEKNKRCKDCICKHFMHIIALSEEAQMLAGSDLAKFPFMEDSPALYNDLFKQWLKQRTNDAVQRRIEEKLRERRKQLVQHYVLGAGAAK